MTQNPNDPTNPDAPWEEAMSRDFDARVRDLHEAPIDFTSVKGRARKIRRNRRAAVAGGILGVAAIVTPIAVLTTGGETSSKEPDFAPEVTETADSITSDVDADYLLDGVWHQADGDAVVLPENATPYDAAVLWDDQLVTTRWNGEVFFIAEVFDAEGTPVTSFPTTAPVVVNDAGTTIAWVGTDGRVMTRWDGGEAVLGEVDLAAPGEAVAWSATAITGGPSCDEGADGCTVFLNTGLEDEEPTTFSSHGIDDNPVPGAFNYRDASTVGGFAVTYVSARNEDASICTGLFDLQTGRSRWTTCDYDAQAISPNGQYVVGAPAYGSGLGPTELAILDGASGRPTGSYDPEGQNSFLWSAVTWTDANTLLVSMYDGDTWRLVSVAPDGSHTELAGPVDGREFDNPFVPVGR